MPKAGFKILALAATLGAFAAAIPTLAAAETTRITLALSHPAIGVGEEVFLYAVPKHLGYFRDEGLEVGVQTGNLVLAAKSLQSGSVQFATTMADVILKIREQGGDLLAFASLKRNNGHMVAVVPELPVHRLEDMKGKTIGALSWSTAGGLELMAGLADLGVGAADYRRVTTGAGAAAGAALHDKQIDALVLWDAMFAAMENAGGEFRYIDVPGQKLAGYSLTTTDRFAKEHPDTVEGFCRAVTKGLYFTRTDTTAAVRILLEEYPVLRVPGEDAETTVKKDVRILDAYLANAEMNVPYEAKTGNILPEVWSFIDKFQREQGMLTGSQPPESGYTNRYFEACNRFDRPAVAAAARGYGKAR